MRFLVTFVTSLAVLAAAPALASAKTFRGESGQQRAVSLRTGDDGVPTFVRIPWKARCRRNGGRATFEDRTDFGPPFDSATVDALADAGSYRLRDPGGFRHTVTITLTGRRTLTDPANPATERWTGTIAATIKVRRRGRSYDSCTLRETPWSVAPVG